VVELADEHYPDSDRIRGVLDNRNTPTPAACYRFVRDRHVRESFAAAPSTARRISRFLGSVVSLDATATTALFR